MNMNIVHIGKGITGRQNDSAEKQALPFANPPCEMELTDADLGGIYGGGLAGNLLGNLPLVGSLTANLPLVGGGQGEGH
jgi:mersacidin/lichenicidin family type 2 lantibiotic